MTDELRQPRELIAGDAVAMVSSTGQAYVPMRFVRIRPDGLYEFRAIVRDGSIPTDATTEGTMLHVIPSAYGDARFNWRFWNEPGVTFVQACICRNKRNPDDIYSAPKNNFDCEYCNGRFHLPWEPFANEPRI